MKASHPEFAGLNSSLFGVMYRKTDIACIGHMFYIQVYKQEFMELGV